MPENIILSSWILLRRFILFDIRIIDDNEKVNTKKLYEVTFDEDDEYFIDYYYNYKIKDSAVVVTQENQKILGMLHLNKYKIKCFDEIFNSYYIVAVACDINYRRRGIMRNMLYKAFEYMYKKEAPFTYLIPADKAYYLPFGFRFISKKCKYINIGNLHDYKVFDISEIIKYRDYIDKCLEEYDVYCVRDDKYYDDYIKQLISQKGFIKVYSSNDEIELIEVYWGREKAELKEIYAPKCACDFKDDYFMGRVVNVKAFLSLLRLKNKDTDEIKLHIRINDKIIKENNGVYKCIVMRDKTIVTVGENLDCSDITDIDIDELFEMFVNNWSDICNNIKGFENIYFTEAV